MKTTKEFNAHYTKYGLLNTIETFCNSDDTVMIGYTFDHIALGDYNLADYSIDFCLDDDGVMDWLYEQYLTLPNTDYTSDNIGANYNWYRLIDVTEAIILFLNWLKTIPADVRDYLDGYWRI